MSELRRLHLVRHAPVAGPAGVIHGPDAPADVTNHALALATQAALLKSAPRPGCWSSPALRTRQTAAALGLEPTIDPRLAEQNFGDWTGRRHAELATEPGDSYARFWQDPAANAPPGGESFIHQVARMRTFMDAAPAGDHIAVTHSGSIRAALCVALAMAPSAALGLVIDPLSITLLEHMPGGWRIAYVNRLAGWP